MIFHTKNIINRFVLFLSISCLVFLLNFTTVAQAPHFTETFTIEEGLDQISVRRILRDDVGKIWVFSDLGVQLFNGSDFENLAVLKNVDMEEIYEISLVDSLGIVLLGKEKSYAINTKSQEIVGLTHEAGVLPYVINKQLAYYDNKKKTLNYQANSFELPIGDLMPKKILVGDGEIMIFAEESTLFILDKSSQNLVMTLTNVGDILGYVQGKCLIIKDDTVYDYEPSIGLTSRKLQGKYGKLRYDRKGNALLGLSDDPRRIKSFFLLKQNEEIEYGQIAYENDKIRDYFAEDFEESLLLGTYNGLTYQSYGRHITHLLAKDDAGPGGYGEVTWWIINRKKTKEIYFALESDAVYKYSEGNNQQIFPSNEFPASYQANFYGYYDELNDLLISSSLISSSENYVLIWDFEKSLTKIKSPIRVYAFSQAEDGLTFLAGRMEGSASISILDPISKEIKENHKIDSIGSTIYQISRVGDKLFLSTNVGLFSVEYNAKGGDKKFTNPNCILRKPTADHRLHGNYLLVGTFGDGLYILENNKVVKHLTVEQGLIGHMVHTIGTDEDKNIWLSTLRGITVLDSELNIIKNIRTQDGLSSLDLNSRSFAMKGDTVLVGTVNGLNIISKDILNSKPYSYLHPQQINYTTKGQQFSQRITHAEHPTIPYGIDSFDINFKDYTLYRTPVDKDYLFENTFIIDGKEVALDNLTLATQINGNRIDINHKNSLGEVSILKIPKESFLQHYWLVILLVLLVIALISLLLWLNNKRLSEKHKESLDALQIRLDGMRSSALRAQMNPHFIFNALGSIQYYIQRQESQLAEEYLSDFASLMRKTLESSKEDFVHLGEEIEMLRLYVKLEHSRFEGKFDFEFKIDEDIDKTAEVPSMIVQPFVENAINHGLYNLIERKGHLTISIKEESDEQICCVVEDNGIGREKAKQYSTRKHKSRAMDIIAERMTLLEQSANQVYSVEIEDVMIGQQVNGTRATIRFGLPDD